MNTPEELEIKYGRKTKDEIIRECKNLNLISTTANITRIKLFQILAKHYNIDCSTYKFSEQRISKEKEKELSKFAPQKQVERNISNEKIKYIIHFEDINYIDENQNERYKHINKNIYEQLNNLNIPREETICIITGNTNTENQKLRATTEQLINTIMVFAKNIFRKNSENIFESTQIIINSEINIFFIEELKYKIIPGKKFLLSGNTITTGSLYQNSFDDDLKHGFLLIDLCKSEIRLIEICDEYNYITIHGTNISIPSTSRCNLKIVTDQKINEEDIKQKFPNLSSLSIDSPLSLSHPKFSEINSELKNLEEDKIIFTSIILNGKEILSSQINLVNEKTVDLIKLILSDTSKIINDKINSLGFDSPNISITFTKNGIQYTISTLYSQKRNAKNTFNRTIKFGNNDPVPLKLDQLGIITKTFISKNFFTENFLIDEESTLSGNPIDEKKLSYLNEKLRVIEKNILYVSLLNSIDEKKNSLSAYKLEPLFKELLTIKENILSEKINHTIFTDNKIEDEKKKILDYIKLFKNNTSIENTITEINNHLQKFSLPIIPITSKINITEFKTEEEKIIFELIVRTTINKNFNNNIFISTFIDKLSNEKIKLIIPILKFNCEKIIISTSNPSKMESILQ
jgi:hypothetical protein